MKKKLNCILLIDDDEPTNFPSEMLIQDGNCAMHTEVAQSGRAALNHLTNSENFAGQNKRYPRPDLIFLDINMPAMNGWEFINKYNNLDKEYKGEIIIVLLTNSLNEDDKLKANEMPAISGFENKPLNAEKLNNILKKYFPSNF